MPMSDLTKKSAKDLIKLISGNKTKLRELRFKAKGSRLRDDKEIRRIKKEVARAKTILNKK